MEIVLVTEGKHETVDYVSVKVFDTMREALEFCDSKNTGKKKYWTDTTIIQSGEKIELIQPDYELE